MRTSLLTLVAFVSLALTVPAAGQTAVTTCTDGTASATSGRGACSGHGGVDKARTKAAKQEAKSAAKEVAKSVAASGTMETCGDGSSSKPGRGACSRHGGVKGASATLVPAPAAQPVPSPAATAATSGPRTMPATRATPSTPAHPTKGASGRREDSDPTGAIAQCKDGMYSHAANRRGACSRHRGVAKWM